MTGGNLDGARPVFWFLTSHWLSVLGSSLVTIAGCSWLFILALHAGEGTANPYIGLLTAFAIPVIFFAGLALIPLGAWLARRRIESGLAVAPSRPAVLRRLAIFFGAMTVVNVIIASQVTYRAVGHMESDQFCGATCHVMNPQFVANQRTVHRNVGCVECHILPGAAGFLQAKMNGTKQLLEVALNDFPRPVPPALQSNRQASSAETCEHCHSRATDLGMPVRVISKFKDDEANTPTHTVLVMNIGGGAKAGIHSAHMGAGVEIRYRADAKRQVIPWVEYRNTKTNEVRAYTAAGGKAGPTQEFTMQCADCHNRQGHSFEQPDEAVDAAMAAGQIPVKLPFSHKTAVEILKASYSGPEDAGRSIPAAFSGFYLQKYPDIATTRGNEIASAGKVLAELYQSNVFTEFGVKWGTYPSNLGHADNAGCFRCHDESHATPQKKTITQDCSSCHNPLAVDETSPSVLKSLGLDEKLAQALKP